MQSNMEAAAYALGEAFGSWLPWIILVIIAKNFICSLFCGSLAGAKGYSGFGYFLLGLIFGELVLLYMVGMPLSYEEERERQTQLAEVLVEAGFLNNDSSEDVDEDSESLDDDNYSTKLPDLGDKYRHRELDTTDFDAELN